MNPFSLCLLALFTLVQSLPINILHLTDLHYDDDYTIGSPDNCWFVETGMGCCRKISIPKSPFLSAQAFGDYNCDSPVDLVNSTLNWISTHNKVDMIILTGDYASHNVVLQSLEENIEAGELVGKLTKFWFPSTPVIWSLGNHDTWPVDQLFPMFHGSKLSQRFTNMLKEFNWLNKDELTEFSYGGYYKRYLPTDVGNIKVLVLNSLFYDNTNYLDKWEQDPEEQYAWVRQEVEESSKLNLFGSNLSIAPEKVWIVSHINPGNSGCSDDYVNLIKELCINYPNVIQYQFYGHVHNGFIQSIANGTCSSFVGPSIVPSTDIKQPQYRIYTYDDGLINKYIDYYGNITLFNEYQKVEYNILYDTSTEGMNVSVSAEILKILGSLPLNPNFLSKFYNWFYTYSPLKAVCDHNCQLSFLNDYATEFIV